MKYLVDTSVVTRASNEHVKSVLRAFLLNGEICRTTLVDLEMGGQARNSPEWEGLTDSVAPFPTVETAERNLQRALQVQRLLAAKSQRGRKIPDLLIAAVAEEHNLTVLHYDSDFDIIAEVTGQSCRWIVPAGTID